MKKGRKFFPGDTQDPITFSYLSSQILFHAFFKTLIIMFSLWKKCKTYFTIYVMKKVRNSKEEIEKMYKKFNGRLSEETGFSLNLIFYFLRFFSKKWFLRKIILSKNCRFCHSILSSPCIFTLNVRKMIFISKKMQPPRQMK